MYMNGIENEREKRKGLRRSEKRGRSGMVRWRQG
jgi:hypothetical protein